MTSLIIKSKIWNQSNSSIINYKDKKFSKQKITIEKSGILSLKKEKLFFRHTDNLDNSGNSSQDTNYMNEARDNELISIQKAENDSNFYVNCGDWSKDLMQLIDQNAVYFLYKGLTIENFLKEKQKYYVLNQGDIIKVGKIYLKILHIKLTGPDKNEEEKDKADKATDKHSDNNKKLVSDSDSSSSDDSDSDDDSESNKENGNENSIKNDEKEDEAKSVIMKRSYSPYDSNNNSKKNEFAFNSFSNKNENKKNKNMRYNKLSNSFNGNLSDMNLDKKIKENIGIKRSMSFKLKSVKNLSISANTSSKINNNNNAQKKLKKSKSKKLKKKFSNKNKYKPNKSDLDKPQQKKGKICRICLSEEDSPKKNPLICPCTCKGSMKYIHYNCLKNWLNLKIESELGYGNDIETEQPTITYSTKDISCELCKTKLPDYVKHKGQIYNVSFYKPKYSKFIVLESIRDDNRRTKFIHIIPLNKKQIVKIGRLNNCDLSLPDYSISRVHCCMYIETGQLFLENNSKFGTKILVQTPKLLMSPDYPLSIEVQKVYLKISVQKPFSLFSCCNVYTTSVTKMLVYQKQNEKGFDLFCSMVFKEDNENEDNADDNIENENNNEENESNKNDNKNLISDEIKGNEDKNNNKDDNKDDKDNKEKNKKNKIVKNFTIKKEKETKLNLNQINIPNKSKEEIIKKNNLNNKEFNEQLNEEKKEKENLIDNEDINSLNLNLKKEKEKEELIDDDDKINENINKEKEKEKEKGKEKEKEKELIDDDDKSSEDKKSIKKLKEKEIEIISKNIINNIMNTENDKLKESNNENKNKNIIDNKNEIKENEKANDINKNEDKKDIKTKINEPKISKVEEIKNSKEIKKEKEIKHKIEFNEKKEIKINKKEESNKENDNLKNEKRINYLNTEEKPKEKKENKEKCGIIKINYEKDESDEKEIIEKEKNVNKINDVFNNEINSKCGQKNSANKKIQKKSIDLNAINDLSYKHGQDTSIKNSALENYQCIYGLMPSKKNDNVVLLAPKYTKNKNLKNFDFNISQEKTDSNCSNSIWNKYTCQYEENKRMKDK